MDLAKRHCVSCEKGSSPLSEGKEMEMLKLVQHDNNGSGWILLREGTHKLRRQFKLKNFREAISFVNNIADVAEKEGHHPDIKIVYNRVQLDLFTHAVGGLSENDFILASKINRLEFET